MVQPLGGARTTDVRGVLAPLKAMAERQHIACLLITHFNKNTAASAINRITDSLAFGATVRHCYCCIAEKDSTRKLFLRVKNNLAPNDEEDGLAYSFEVRRAAPGIRVPCIVWGNDHIDLTANEALAELRHAGGRPDNMRVAAKELIQEMLADGNEVDASEIEQQGEKRSISLRTLRRAADELEVIKSGAKGRKGKSTWRLPEQ
jgi:hypothetical protein